MNGDWHFPCLSLVIPLFMLTYAPPPTILIGHWLRLCWLSTREVASVQWKSSEQKLNFWFSYLGKFGTAAWLFPLLWKNSEQKLRFFSSLGNSGQKCYFFLFFRKNQNRGVTFFSSLKNNPQLNCNFFSSMKKFRTELTFFESIEKFRAKLQLFCLV